MVVIVTRLDSFNCDQSWSTVVSEMIARLRKAKAKEPCYSKSADVFGVDHGGYPFAG